MQSVACFLRYAIVAAGALAWAALAYTVLMFNS